jgi:hypothetical protein
VNRWWLTLLLLSIPLVSHAQIRAPQGWWQQEDARLRSHVMPLPYGIEEVLRMQPYRYIEKLPNGERVQSIGLMAQELGEIIPEAVRPPSKSCEYWAIDYSRLVPVLITALQYQQRQLAELQQQLDDLRQQRMRDSDGRRYAEPSPGINAVDALLGQNIPNPHDGTTAIPCYVPSGVSRAELVITDASGRIVRIIAVSTRDAWTSVTLDMNDFATGSYEYRLLLDGRVVASRTMQLIR